MDKVVLNNKEAWLRNASLWQTYEPPIRPSAGELMIYDLALRSKSGDPFSRRALLLGDCPELRDLLAEHNFMTTVVANDPQAIIAMNQLLQYKGERKEKILITNWQDLDLDGLKFDLILSDWSLNSLPYWREYTLVLDNVKKHLSPQGLFIARVNVFRPERKNREVRDILREWHASQKNKFSFLLELEMYSELSTYDRSSFQINLGEFYRDKITSAYHDKIISFEDWQEFYYPFFTVTLTYPEKGEMKYLLMKFFTTVGERFGGDYPFSHNEPIFICKQE